MHFNLRGDDTRACLLVIFGVLPDGTKELVAIDGGVRESTQNWYELLVHLRDHQGLANVPQLAIGDGALGFWNAASQVRPHATSAAGSIMPRSGLCRSGVAEL